MKRERAEKKASRRARPRSGPGPAWLLVTWARLVIGLGLTAEGAVLYTNARTIPSGPSWIVGAIAIGLGAILTLSGVYSLAAATRRQEQIVPDNIPARREAAIPMLGALLVYKYGAITESQLERALEQQRKEGRNRRRLGEILLDMGLVSASQLQEALKYQRSRAAESSPPPKQPKARAGDGEAPKRAKRTRTPQTT